MNKNNYNIEKFSNHISLKNVIEIDGVEYGFHPNLDDITLGEYADLETFIKMGIKRKLYI